jgi:hypothetical protein
VVEPGAIFKMAKRLWHHFQSSGEFEVATVMGGVDIALLDWVTDEA